MKLMIGAGGDHIEISELYCGVALSTKEGEKIGICQRDGIFEVSVLQSKSGNPIRIMQSAPKSVELAATDSQQLQAEIVFLKECLDTLNSHGSYNVEMVRKRIENRISQLSAKWRDKLIIENAPTCSGNRWWI